MIFQTVLFSLLLASASSAQTTSNNTQLGIEAIEAHFTQAGIVASGNSGLLSSFDPSALLTASFDGVGAISPGQALTQTQVSAIPSVSVTAANSTVSLHGNFTLIMVDAGPVGTDEVSQGQTRHWLENGVTVDSGNISNSSAMAITKYAGPAPASGSGAHRYVILLYYQPSTFANPSNITDGVTVIHLDDYVQQSGLGPLLAATYFTVEVGAASFTPSATSSVITSTLPADTPPASSTASYKSASPSASSTAKSTATAVRMTPLVAGLACLVAALALVSV